MARQKNFVSSYSGLNTVNNRFTRYPGPVRSFLIRAVPWVTWGTILAIDLFCTYKFARFYMSGSFYAYSSRTILGTIAMWMFALGIPTVFIGGMLAGQKIVGFEPFTDLFYWILGHRRKQHPVAMQSNANGQKGFMTGYAAGSSFPRSHRD